MKLSSGIAALLVALAVCGCGGSTATSADKTSAESTSTSTTEEKIGFPVPAVPPQKEPLKKLVIKNLKAGEGPAARWGDTAIVRYVGVYYKTGKSYSPHWGYTADFKLDGKTIGPGWQKGIHGMKAGGRREILIPARLIFEGSDGDLAYVLELVRIKPGPRTYAHKGPFAAITAKGGKHKPVIDPPDRPAPKKLLFRSLEEGSGPPAERRDEIAIRYDGAMYATGELRYGGKTRLFPLGSGNLGGAFERGLVGMRAGSRRELIVPSRLLGDSGAVDYMIELVKIAPDAE
ncbi:MAG TPA: FKBP-type peptidyl-prolyl cis-trans isomerase [Solirubrobacterales bacterium]|nr:FKBP-type peptidyl-prolyl cis-trans isomerase [Solirubrobacterales bacterium]